MAKRYAIVAGAILFAATAAAIPGGAFACEIDGFMSGLVPPVAGEQASYVTTGNVPPAENPALPAGYQPPHAEQAGSVASNLVLGLALLAAPLFATLTVVAARKNRRG